MKKIVICVITIIIIAVILAALLNVYTFVSNLDTNQVVSSMLDALLRWFQTTDVKHDTP